MDVYLNQLRSKYHSPAIALAIYNVDNRNNNQSSIYYVSGMSTLPNQLALDNTIFRTGSLTKLFTADLIIKYNIPLDDPISKYFPILGSIPFGNSTIRLILEHRSGLPRDLSKPAKTLQSILEELLITRTSSNNKNKNNKNYVYSNVGYILLRYLLEVYTSQRYDTLLKSYLDELGMYDSSLTLDVDITTNNYYNKYNNNLATGYRLLNGRLIAVEESNNGLYGLGSLSISIRDLSKYLPIAYSSNKIAYQQRGTNNFIKTGSVPGFSAGILIKEGEGQAIGFLSNLHGIENLLINDLIKMDLKQQSNLEELNRVKSLSQDNNNKDCILL